MAEGGEAPEDYGVLEGGGGSSSSSSPSHAPPAATLPAISRPWADSGVAAATSPHPALHAATSPHPSLHAAISSSSFTHTPFYCEENVYLLCKKLSLLGEADPVGLDLFAVFISNEEKQVPLWYQKASKSIDGFVVWDYHVICVQSKRNGEGSARHLVWDLDSTLPFPIPLEQYVTEAFQPSLPSYIMINRLFRVVHAPIYLRCFASDRSHMRDPNGNWISPPPAYNSFVAEDGTMNNIDEYIQVRTADMTTNMECLVDRVFSNKLGVVVGEMQLLELFSQIIR